MERMRRDYRYREGRRLQRLRDEAGGASLAAVGVVLGLLLIMGSVLAGYRILAVQERVAGAADAAALAGADTAFGFVSGVPCERAEQSARLNRVTMDHCTVEGYEVRVTASQSVLGIVVRSAARAGPSPGTL
ncbi:hypothetical protein GCM10022198_25370 [Klugiella xanthotipulae]|uniref:Secretion/DNA translocation related TadE-like protein n=1 Tax=Klugiella xanthotipulae TaxID=244735 RepID=A0A543HYZ9_9MICO|nr:Rv3654c family TadE-like protein [Klugiella xanthotipulae]TQM63572.1 secretion/DNA translocation related TadE-like protein [Klugiella xanthotipulae]